MPRPKNVPPRQTDYVMALFGKALSFMQARTETAPAAMGIGHSSHKKVQADMIRRTTGTEPGKGRQTKLDELAERVSPHLAKLLALDESINLITVSAVDGFELASASRHSSPASPRTSVIMNLIAAVGRAVSSEVAIGCTEYVLINASGGRVIAMHVKVGDLGIIVAVIASERGILGSLINQLKNTCAHIAIALDDPK